jgi:ParB-like chromosome segregation protein Spo0J
MSEALTTAPLTADLGELVRDLEGFRLKDPRRVHVLTETIRATGRFALPPLQVAKIGARLVLVDGFKRLQAAREAGLGRVPIGIVEASRPEALVLLAQLNRSEGVGLSALEEGWIVYELRRAHAWTMERIGTALSRDTSWVCRREHLISRLDPAVQDLLRQGGLDAAAAEEIAVLPRGKQEGLARRAAQGHLSVAQIRALVRLVLQAPTDAHRHYLLNHPREVLALAGGRPLCRDRFSELEVLLQILLSGSARPRPDPATAVRLIPLLRKLLAFLEGSSHVADSGTDRAHSRAEGQGAPLHPRDCQAAQTRA